MMTTSSLANVAPEHVFHFHDGKKAHNLKDLRDAIAIIPDDSFVHHVDDTNNDFANWVEFVYKNPDLADDLRKVSDREKTLEVIDAELGTYGGEHLDDEPIEEAVVQPQEEVRNERKQLHEEPYQYTEPPETITTVDGKTVHTISTEAPHTFLIKEFFWGMITGIVIGLLIMGVLINYGFVRV